jgi:D-3-phosphoglycerate dehydrogenase / 2-oxoglutarate reductase
MKVLIAANISASFSNFLLSNYEEFLSFSELESDNKFNTIEGIVTSNALKLNHIFLEKFPQLKWIARLGSGMEIIDVEYCKANDIHCFSSPNGIANAVAEHTVGMLLSLQHNIHTSYNEIQNKQWIREGNRGIELENMTLGIIGFGHTGKAFANKMKQFVKDVLVYDKYAKNFKHDFIQEVSIDELKKRCNIISFHVPLNDETTYYYNDTFLNEMAVNHILINVSRGQVVSTSTILKGLQLGKITGACLDVVEEENNIQVHLQNDESTIQQLLKYNTLITPHIAGYTFNAIEKMSDELRKQIEQIL